MKPIRTAACAAMIAALVQVPGAWADHEDGHAGFHAATPRGEFHGRIERFHEHDWGLWHSGHWYHGDHGGRLGWWWVAGGIWYVYPYPVYPYPDPYLPPDLPEPAVPPPPKPTTWYFCRSADAYYPYVTGCAEGWQVVPANPAAGH
jgi:hypothetical protein